MPDTQRTTTSAIASVIGKVALKDHIDSLRPKNSYTDYRKSPPISILNVLLLNGYFSKVLYESNRMTAN